MHKFLGLPAVDAAAAAAPAALATGVKRPRDDATPGAAAPAAAPAAASQQLVALGLAPTHPAFPLLLAEVAKPYFRPLSAFVAAARAKGTCYPPPGRELAALQLMPDLRGVKVVILGQDPYHGAGQACGLAFSVPRGCRPLPPSLKNMLKELRGGGGGADGGGGGGGGGGGAPAEEPPHGDLTGWARQGVLLLNTCLTVSAGAANSHAGQGWERFTDSIISAVSREAEGAVFMLWGLPAQKKKPLIQGGAGKHLVLEAPHPSPLSAFRGFFGCGHFDKANAWLEGKGRGRVNWWPL